MPIGAAGAPPARQDAAVVWDPADCELLVYGGTDIISSTTMSDLWAYRPATHAWTQLVSANPAPVGRFGAAGVWDTIGNRLLIFGGQQGIGTAATFFNDVEAYSPISNTWTTLSAQGAAGAPTPRSRVGAAWDSRAGCLLVFGGETADSPLTLSPQLWAFVPAEGGIAGQDADAQGRQTHQQVGGKQGGLATDPVAGVAGERAAKEACHKADEEREQDQKHADERNRRGAKDSGEDECRHRAVEEDVTCPSRGAWTLLDAGGGTGEPPARAWVPTAWDPAAGVLRILGGENRGGSPLSDTWEWSPAGGWRFDEARMQPAGRAAAAATWDVQHARFLVGPGLGLGGAANDVWAYDPTTMTWLAQNVTNSGTLPPRQTTGMAWDEADGEGLLFGGYVSGVGPANDLWALAPATSTAPPTPSPTSAAVQKALDVGLVVDRNGNLLVTPQEIDAITATGATRVRFSLDLGTSAGWTSTLLNSYGQAITMFENAGIGVIGQVGNGATGDNNQADWTANNHENTGGNGDNPFISSAYTSALRTLVGYFHGPPYNVKLWELWNQPNACTRCGTSLPGGFYIYPSNFAALLADSYQAIKVTDALSDVTLISGGIFGHSIGGVYSPANAGVPYLSATYNIGINVTGTWKTIKAQTGSYPLDAVGQHIYLDQSQYSTPATIRAYEDWLRSAYTSYEGMTTSKPTIVTEEGWATGGTNVADVTTAQQADNVDAAYWAAKDVSYLPIVTWFQLRDNPAANLFHGLYTPTWAAKPALAHYQAQ
jgi:hypothetical protein